MGNRQNRTLPVILAVLAGLLAGVAAPAQGAPVVLGSLASRHSLTAPAASSLAASVEDPSPSRGDFAADPDLARPYFGARYYGSRIGRFTTVDPYLDQSTALVDPQRWNRYAYSRNNPLRYVDPDGKDPVTVAIIVITAAAFVLNNPTNANVTEGPVNDTIIPNSVIVAGGYGLAAGGARMAAKEVFEEATGIPVGGLPGSPRKGGETSYTAAGRRAHAEEPLPPGFERESRLPSGKRMDGYNPQTKEVIEIKPNNPRAVKRGQRQADGYCRECDQTKGPGHAGRVQTYEPKKYLEKKE